MFEMNKIRSRANLDISRGHKGFLVDAKVKAYTKLTFVMCCQIFARRSVVPFIAIGNFRQTPSTAAAGFPQVCNLFYFFLYLSPYVVGPPGPRGPQFKIWLIFF